MKCQIRIRNIRQYNHVKMYDSSTLHKGGIFSDANFCYWVGAFGQHFGLKSGDKYIILDNSFFRYDQGPYERHRSRYPPQDGR